MAAGWGPFSTEAGALDSPAVREIRAARDPYVRGAEWEQAIAVTPATPDREG